MPFGGERFFSEVRLVSAEAGREESRGNFKGRAPAVGGRVGRANGEDIMRPKRLNP